MSNLEQYNITNRNCCAVCVFVCIVIFWRAVVYAVVYANSKMWSDNDGMIHQIKLQGTDNIVKPHKTVLIFVSHQEAVPLSIERLGIDLCCLISGDVTAFAPLKWFKCWTWWQYERIWKVKMRNVYLESHKHALRFLFAPTEVTVVQQKRCTAIPAMKPFVVNLWDTNGCQYDF